MANHKVILVTGGTKGIGKAICRELVQRGQTVLFTYRRNPELAGSTVAELLQLGGGKAQAYPCDMAVDQDVKKLFRDIKTEHGGVEVVVNNAGVTGNPRQFILTSEADWWEVFNNNLKGVLNTTRFALPSMIARKGGIFINITSVSAHQGTPGSSAYSTSKAAIIAFTKCIYKEHAIQGIYAFSVSPGFVETDMIKEVNGEYMQFRMSKSPLRRTGNPEEVANLVAYLADSPPALLGGQDISIDGLQ